MERHRLQQNHGGRPCQGPPPRPTFLIRLARLKANASLREFIAGTSGHPRTTGLDQKRPELFSHLPQRQPAHVTSWLRRVTACRWGPGQRIFCAGRHRGETCTVEFKKDILADLRASIPENAAGPSGI